MSIILCWHFDNVTLECEEGEIRCGDNTCVQGAMCDGIFDCVDSTDEYGCDACSSNQFHCTSGECIDEEYRCDGQRHCEDHSDEHNCGMSVPCQCLVLLISLSWLTLTTNCQY